jgi:hypothetical protein
MFDVSSDSNPIQGLDPGRLPIVLGAVGHRHLDPADAALYRDQISLLIRDLRHRYPTTPLRVISPLAEGADCLIAEVALAHRCELLVPLPMEPDEYEKDFPQSVDTFRALLKRIPAHNVFVLPAEGEPCHAADEEWRNRCYAAAGIYVATHCHVLVALWDGVEAQTGVGTGAVVRLKLEGTWLSHGRPNHGLDTPDSGPVYHIMARRPNQVVESCGVGRWLYPAESDAGAFELIFGRMQRFNSDPARIRVAERIEAGATSLLPEIADRPASDRGIATAFAFADQMSSLYRNMTLRVLRGVLSLAAILAMTYEFYAEILPVRAVPVAYLALFATICLVYGWQRRVDAQGRYLDYRAVAEGLRVQFYWRLAGLRDDVCANYLRKQLDELRWIREALRGASAVAPASNARLDRVVSHWIRGQSEFYRGRAAHLQHRHHRIDAFSLAFVVAGLLATALLVVFWEPLEHTEKLHRWVVLLMGFAPIGAALWEAYGEKMGLRSQANQYARFAVVFRRAQNIADHLGAEPASAERHAAECRLVLQLGRESLMENGDWVLLLRERPIVVPKG